VADNALGFGEKVIYYHRFGKGIISCI